MQPQEANSLKSAKESKTLDQLLETLLAADEGMIDVNLDEQLDLMDQGRVKVDNYKYIADRLDAQADLFKKWSKEFSEMEKAVRNNKKRLMAHLTFTLKKHGFDKFTGHRYVVLIRKSKPAVEIKAPASSILKLKFPTFIKTEYTWNKAKLYQELKAGNKDVEQIAELKESLSPKFDINKGV